MSGCCSDNKRSSGTRWLFGLALLAGVGALGANEWHKARAQDPAQARPDTMVVFKSPTCSCCSKWIEHLKKAGIAVEIHNDSAMEARKRQLGVPETLASCHTGVINGYVIEGHVPAEDIQRLLIEKPKAKGLAVPGMPVGSPGMEMADNREPYASLLFQAEGQSQVFVQHGEAAK